MIRILSAPTKFIFAVLTYALIGIASFLIGFNWNRG